MIDDPDNGPQPALADSGVNYNGVIGVLNFANHIADSREVSGHTAGSDVFEYSPALSKYKNSRYYFFEGGVGDAELVMLDTAQEWAYDETEKTLWLWADDGETPEGRHIRGKTQTFAFIGDASTQHVTIDGLNFFATSFSFESSDYITIQNNKFDYYSASRRALGETHKSLPPRFAGSEEDFVNDITIYNNEFKHADSSAIFVNYSDNLVVENNLFHEIDYATSGDLSYIRDGEDPGNPHTLYFGDSRNITYRRNTVDTAGAAQTFWTRKYDQDEEWNFSIIEYNYHTVTSVAQDDGSSVYMAHEDATESLTRFNWFYNNFERDFRYDGNNSPLKGIKGDSYRNVSHGGSNRKGNIVGGGSYLKGDYHEVYNSIAIDYNSTLAVPYSLGGNDNSKVHNNAARQLDISVDATASNNHDGNTEDISSMCTLLRSPNNFDFRPDPDYDALIDQGIEVSVTRLEGYDDEYEIDVTDGYLGEAPDIGAYEHGEDSYWIPGRQPLYATMGVPRDTSVSARLDSDLMYLIGRSGVEAHIYIGTSPTSLDYLASQTEPDNILELDELYTLEEDQTYYWRVDTEREDGDVTTGEVWSFSTGSTLDEVEVTGVQIINESVVAEVGESVQLTAQPLPIEATNQKILWHSSDYNVANVDEDGVVTILSEGYAIVTAISEDSYYEGEYYDTVLVSSGSLVRLQSADATDYVMNADLEELNVNLGTVVDDGSNQYWIEIDRGSGFYSYQLLSSSYCLDGGDGGANGQNVGLVTCADDDYNQQWKKVDNGSGYELRKRSDVSWAISNRGEEVSDGLNIFLWAKSANWNVGNWVIDVVDGDW